MNFTGNRSEGFESFDQCYDHHLERSKKNSSIKMDEIFKVEIGKLRPRLPESIGIRGGKRGDGERDGERDRDGDGEGRKGRGGRGGRGGRISDDTSFILKHFDEIELYEGLEDEYNCSGMCHSSLFFFSRPLHEGRPT